MTVAAFDPPPAYPVTIAGGTEIDLEISSDALVGVVLDRVHSVPAPGFDHLVSLVDLTAAGVDLDGRLWEIIYTRQGEDAPDPVPLSPRDAASFASYDVTAAYGSTAQALLFVWAGIRVPRAADKDLLQVSVLVRMDTNDELSHWNLWVTREHGNSVSVDEVEFPVLWIRGPATEEGGETHHEGQKRARVITPANAMPLSLSPTSAPSTDLWTWANTELRSQCGYPASNQPLQFMAISSVHDPATGDVGWRRPLIVIAEDANGYVKHFNYRGHHYTAGAADDAYLRFSIGHLPSFHEDLGDKRTVNEWGNSYEMPYDVTMGVRFAGAKGVLWYDVARHYRDRMMAIGAMPPEIESNPDLTSAISRKPGIWLGVIHLNTFGQLEGPSLYEGFMDYARTLRSVVRTAEAPLDTMWVQIQTWLRGFLQNPRRNLGEPLPWGIGEGLEEIVRRELEEGIVSIAYTRPGDLARVLDWVIPEAVLRRGRDGHILTNASGPLLDSSPAMETWWPDNMTKLIHDFGFRGQYMDSLGSGPERMSYPGNGTHPPHGGRWIADSQKVMVENVRAKLGHPDASLGTESVIEPLTYKTNIQQEGVFYYPGHGLLMEENVRLSVTNVPEQARHVAPPIWQAVYHGRHPAQSLAMHMGTCLLDTNTDWNPSAGKPGLSAAEFIDVFCWLYGTIWAHGNVPLLMQCQYDFEGFDPTVSANGSGLTNKIVTQQPWGSVGISPKDPTGAGIEVMRFIRTLVQAQLRSHAGEFIQFGELLEPLVPDYTSVNNSRQANPMALLDPFSKIDIARARQWGMLPAIMAVALLNNGILFTWQLNATFEVPDALYQMWRSPSGTVGMVVVNWSASAATFRAEFNPADYGVATPYDIIQRNLGGAPTVLDTGIGAGGRIIGNSGVVDTALPSFAAHSVYVFTFEPT